MAKELSTLGIKVYWVAAPISATPPTSGWDMIGNVKALPDYDTPPDLIDVTDLSELRYHKYIPGLKNISEPYTMRANLTQASLDEWNTIVGAFTGDNVIWIAISIPGLNKAFFLYGQPIELGMPPAEVNTALEINFSIVPMEILGWNDKPNFYDTEVQITSPADGGTYIIGDTIQGAASAGSQVQVSVGDIPLSPTVTASNDNTFTLDPQTDIDSGTGVFTATQTVDGDTSPKSDPVTAEIVYPVQATITSPIADALYYIGDSITGTGMAAAKAYIKIAGQDILPNPVIQSDNTFSFVPTSTLTPGVQTIQVAQNVDGDLTDYSTPYNINIQPNFSTDVAITTTDPLLMNPLIKPTSGAYTEHINGVATHGATVKLYKDNFDSPIPRDTVATDQNTFSLYPEFLPTGSVKNGDQIQIGAAQTLNGVTKQSEFVTINCIEFSEPPYTGVSSSLKLSGGYYTGVTGHDPFPNGTKTIIINSNSKSLTPSGTVDSSGNYDITFDTPILRGTVSQFDMKSETFGASYTVYNFPNNI